MNRIRIYMKGDYCATACVKSGTPTIHVTRELKRDSDFFAWQVDDVKPCWEHAGRDHVFLRRARRRAPSA